MSQAASQFVEVGENSDCPCRKVISFLAVYSSEIGQIMGRSEGAIKSLYHRTLLALREAWAGTGER